MKNVLRDASLESNVIICAFADHRYKTLLAHWLRLVKLTGHRRVLVFCFDEETRECASQYGAISILTPFQGDWLGFMRHQMELVIQMLELGYCPLISDIDALWLKDPVPYTIAHKQDMVFSVGSIQPLSAHAAWGNVLCTGYFLLRPHGAVIKLMKEALRLMKSMGDQPAINQLLIDRGLKFSLAQPYTISFRNHDVVQCPETRIGSTQDISVALLPNKFIQRLNDPKHSDPYVIHPIAPKVEADKISLFRSLGLWHEGLLTEPATK